MRTQDLTISRGGAFALVAILHAALIYAVAIGMGVMDVPLAHVMQAAFITAEKPEIREPVAPPTATPQFAGAVIRMDTPSLVTAEPEPAAANEIEAIAPKVASGGGSMEYDIENPVAAAPLITSEPVYPLAAIRGDEQGVVLLKALVNTTGRVEDVVVLRSSGYSRLDQAAVKSVRTWRFKPAMQANAAIASWVTLPIRFQLH